MGTRYTWLFAGAGSTIFGLLPTIWGSSFLSFTSILFSAFGAIIGIWIAFKVNQY